MPSPDSQQTIDPIFWLRNRIRTHNLNVMVLTAGSLLFAALLYTILFGIGYWLWIFGESITRGLEARTPLNYPRTYGIIVLSLLFIHGTIRSWKRYHGAPERKILGTHVFWELVFMPSAYVFEGLETPKAWVRLRYKELDFAKNLLAEMRQEGSIPLDHLPGLFPASPSVRVDRTILALQLLQVIDLYHTNGQSFLGLRHSQVEDLHRVRK